MISIHKIVFSILIIVIIIPEFVRCQVNEVVKINLNLNREYEQKPAVSWIDFSADSSLRKKLNVYKNLKIGLAPGNVIVSAEDLNRENTAYLIKIDSDGDSVLVDENDHILEADSTIYVQVVRHWNNGISKPLEYSIWLKIFRRNDGVNEEVFYWRPHYRAEGILKYKDCENFFAALDLNGDGIFDKKDFRMGTTINIDRNNDNLIWGADEWLFGEEVIEYCNSNFLIRELAPDGSLIVLEKIDIVIPIVGKKVPSFQFKTLDGETIKSNEMNGKNYLLDFWASWCKPCVANFVSLKELFQVIKGGIQLFSINVDDSTRLEKAYEVVKEHNLSWPQVITGKGNKDPIWQMFGNIRERKLSIPLYALIDSNGVLKYAGNGGLNLEELKQALDTMNKVEEK